MGQERDSYPNGVPNWVDTVHPDPEAAATFYAGLFGWELEDLMPPDAPGNYFMATLNGSDVAAIGSQPEGHDGEATWNTYVAVDSADAAAAKAEDAGGKVLAGPYDVFEAGRMATLADAEGATFSVWEAKERIGAKLVNEPGTWNFSELNTHDARAAESFYGSVFGWEAATLELGDGDFTFWRLPGYGDFLAERDPELRERQAADGAPGGFEDAVAVLVQDGVPPHWSITFAVDDADAAAAKTAELGGTVMVPPFDAPYVRMTILRDPQGATFTASKYMPPG